MNDKQTMADIAPSTIEMVERDLVKPGKMQWWYRIAAPPEPGVSSSFKQREAYRRGKLISIALLVLMLVAVAVFLTVGLFVNHALLPNLAMMMVLLLIAVSLNRRGNVIVAGILTVVGIDLSLVGNIFTYPAISIFLLPMLDLLVLPELFAVSLLPPVAVFVDAAIHILFIIVSLTLLPQSPELQALLHTPAIQDALARPIVIQILVAVITYLWVRSATQAMERADRALSIALLEREMAEQSVQVIEEKRQLEGNIQQIFDVHARVANGDYSARVPLDNLSLRRGYALWEIAGSLNNLLARLQRFRQDSIVLQRTNEAITRFIQVRNQTHNNLIPWQPTGTAVDILVQQHNTFIQTERTMHRNNAVPPVD
ncbi:MAG: hypothetical protein IMW89_13310 [Ktedonobacteraceae bacterium]|nr:hypothetical protein [Ktedonobacteraceae bacterium]